MMFNPQQQQHQQHPQQQQFVNAQNGAHQSPYGTPSMGMGGGGNSNAGAVGMMQHQQQQQQQQQQQNNGLAHMAGGHVPQYQTPYTSSPYGAGIPIASNPPMQQQNFLPQSSNPPKFSMNAPNMTPQQQMQNQRMHPPGSNVTPSGQRTSPYGVQQGTPPNPAMTQSQFSTPQNPAQNMGSMSNANQSGQGPTVVTPQTPTFPQGPNAGNAGAGVSNPQSPGSEAREKERVTLLLEINRELLLESMLLQGLIAEGKEAAAAANANATDPQAAEKEKAEKDKAQTMIGKEYLECMRRLQSNLAYLASIADRSHKPSNQIPPHPAIMSAPNLSQKPAKAPKITDSTTASPTKDESTEERKFAFSNEDRDKILKELYKRLQALFPGVDPKKEPPLQSVNAAARAQAQQHAAQMQAKQQHQQQQQQQQAGGASGDTAQAQQQKMQQHNQEMLRQRMLLEQAAKQQQVGMASGPMGPPSQSPPQNVQGR
ncbi:hypothetical protein B7463_g5802, partial [Scytalidium lignicola]